MEWDFKYRVTGVVCFCDTDTLGTFLPKIPFFYKEMSDLSVPKYSKSHFKKNLM